MLNHTYWNGIDEESDSNIVDKVINRLCFVSTTLSTVGYGDFTPSSKTYKVLTIILQIYVLLNVAAIYELIHLLDYLFHQKILREN